MAEKIQNQVAKTTDNPQKNLKALITQMTPAIEKALPSVITPERFTRMVFTAISANPELANCSPQSFLGAMMQCAQLGVEPNSALQEAWLIPYRNHGKLECQFQLGYKGLIDLAYRSGEVESIQAQVVYDNDKFEYEYGLEPKLVHVPAKKDRGAACMVYAIFRTKSGGYGFEVMSLDDCKKHAQKYSQSYGSSYSPWTRNFEEMCLKTVLKKCLRYAPLRSDFVKAIVQDETIKTEISDDMTTIADVTDYQEINGDEVANDDSAADGNS